MSKQERASDVHRYPKRAHAVQPETPAETAAPPIQPSINPLAKLGGGGYALVSLEWLNVVMSDPAIVEALARHEATRQHFEWRMRAADETRELPASPVARAIEQRVNRAPERAGRAAATWNLAKGAKEPAGRSESAHRIYAYLVSHSQGATVRQLMDELHMPLSTVQNGLRQLQYRGVVSQSTHR